MKTVKLKNHKSAQATIIINEDTIELYSYNTMVIKATKSEGNNYQLLTTGLYSATTRRHISWFISEYFNTIDYYVIKEGYLNDKIVIAKLTK